MNAVIPWLAPRVGFNPLNHQSAVPYPNFQIGQHRYGADFVGQTANFIGADDYFDDLFAIEGEEEADEDDDMIGANPGRMQNRLGRRQNRLARANAIAQNSRPGGLRQRFAMATADRLQRRNFRTEQKMRALGAGLGMGPDAIPLGAAGSPAVQAYEQLAAQQQARSQLGYRNTVQSLPGPGEQVKIPLRINGANKALVEFAAGAADEQTLIWENAQITYAGFKVIGVEYTIDCAPGENAQGFVPGDVLLSAEASSLNVNGDINLFYGAQSVNFASGFKGSSQQVISGLRANPPLAPNNTAQSVLTVAQEITHATDISLLIQAKLVAQRLYDPRASTDA